MALLQPLIARRLLSGQRRGSSRPVLVETADGPRLVKLRGAAQGTGPLVAEVIVAALAEALELRVPARGLVLVEGDLARVDRDQELGDLLAASAGENLGFVVLEGAREVQAADLPPLDAGERAAVLWLDRLVLNPDRTAGNPNLLWWRQHAWLIDHGAALRFQYDWPEVSEASPREVGATAAPHLFEAAADGADWATWDQVFAARITRELLEAAAASVPASFLRPLLPASSATEVALTRRRAAYVAFLWKRLQPPRAFATAAPVRLQARASGRGGPP